LICIPHLYHMYLVHTCTPLCIHAMYMCKWINDDMSTCEYVSMQCYRVWSCDYTYAIFNNYNDSLCVANWHQLSLLLWDIWQFPKTPCLLRRSTRCNHAIQKIIQFHSIQWPTQSTQTEKTKQHMRSITNSDWIYSNTEILEISINTTKQTANRNMHTKTSKHNM